MDRPRPMDRPRRSPPAVLALVLVAALIVGACGQGVGTMPPPSASAPISPAPSSPVPSPAGASASAGPPVDAAAIYAQIEAQVEKIRDLQAKSPVDPQLLDEATLKANMAASFNRENPAAEVAANQEMLELLGLLPAGSSLSDLYIKLLGSQVAGYYDPDAKTLYVVSKSGVVGPVEKVTFAHEFDHALQDQNFGLKNLALETIGQGDAVLAHLAVPEGDATSVMQTWTYSGLSLAELAQFAQQATDPTALAEFAAMPKILQQTLLFPYTYGLQFVTGRQQAGGWAAVNSLYAKPPESTEQVLHPEKYDAGEAPIPVSFPTAMVSRIGPGWTVDLQDTLGEFQLRVWLSEVGKLGTDAVNGAAGGWGGDRIALVRNGTRAGLILDTRWDTPADATEFATAATTALEALPGSHQLIAVGGTNRVTLFIATDDGTISAMAGALGMAG